MKPWQERLVRIVGDDDPRDVLQFPLPDDVSVNCFRAIDAWVKRQFDGKLECRNRGDFGLVIVPV